MQIAILPERRISAGDHDAPPAGGWNPVVWLEATEATLGEEWQQTGKVDIKATCSIDEFLNYLWLDTTTPSADKGLWAWFLGPHGTPVCVLILVRTWEDGAVTLQCQTPDVLFDRLPGPLNSPVTYTTGSGSTLEEKPYIFSYDWLGPAFTDAAARVLANNVIKKSDGTITTRPDWARAPMAIGDTSQASQLSTFYGIDYIAIEDVDAEFSGEGSFSIPAPSYLPPSEFVDRVHSIAETRTNGKSYSLVPVFVPPAAGIDVAPIGDLGEMLDYDGGPCFLWLVLPEADTTIGIGKIDSSAILQSDITVTDGMSYVGNTAQFPDSNEPGRPGYAGPWMGVTTGSSDSAAQERKRRRKVGKKIVVDTYNVINKGTLTIDALRLVLGSPINIIDNDIDFAGLGIIPALGMKLKMILVGGNTYTVVIDSLNYTYNQDTGWQMVAPNQSAYIKRSKRTLRIMGAGK